MHPENGKMLSHLEITRILKKSSHDARRREADLFNRDVLDAVQEMTGMKRKELERLAGWATGWGTDGFFSIRDQLLIAGIFMMTLACVVLILFWLL